MLSWLHDREGHAPACAQHTTYAYGASGEDGEVVPVSVLTFEDLLKRKLEEAYAKGKVVDLSTNGDMELSDDDEGGSAAGSRSAKRQRSARQCTLQIESDAPPVYRLTEQQYRFDIRLQLTCADADSGVMLDDSIPVTVSVLHPASERESETIIADAFITHSFSHRVLFRPSPVYTNPNADDISIDRFGRCHFEVAYLRQFEEPQRPVVLRVEANAQACIMQNIEIPPIDLRPTAIKRPELSALSSASSSSAAGDGRRHHFGDWGRIKNERAAAASGSAAGGGGHSRLGDWAGIRERAAASSSTSSSSASQSTSNIKRETSRCALNHDWMQDPNNIIRSLVYTAFICKRCGTKIVAPGRLHPESVPEGTPCCTGAAASASGNDQASSAASSSWQSAHGQQMTQLYG